MSTWSAHITNCDPVSEFKVWLLDVLHRYMPAKCQFHLECIQLCMAPSPCTVLRGQVPLKQGSEMHIA